PQLTRRGQSMHFTHKDSFPSGLWLIRIMFLFALWIGLPAIVLAQIDQGTITGTVTDPSGAVVPNAQVTLTENDTGLVLKSVANKGGFYVFSPVKIGNYTVTASAPGFSTAS